MANLSIQPEDSLLSTQPALITQAERLVVSTIELPYASLTDEQRFTLLLVSAQEGSICTLRSVQGTTTVRHRDMRLLSPSCPVTEYLIGIGANFSVTGEDEHVEEKAEYARGILRRRIVFDKSALDRLVFRQASETVTMSLPLEVSSFKGVSVLMSSEFAPDARKHG